MQWRLNRITECLFNGIAYRLDRSRPMGDMRAGLLLDAPTKNSVIFGMKLLYSPDRTGRYRQLEAGLACALIMALPYIAAGRTGRTGEAPSQLLSGGYYCHLFTTAVTNGASSMFVAWFGWMPSAVMLELAQKPGRAGSSASTFKSITPSIVLPI